VDTREGNGKLLEPDEKTDPLTQTLDLIPLGTHGPNLIKFLFGKPNRTAKVKEICKHIYKAIDKSSLANARRLIGRNVHYLEDRDAPLRIAWDQKISQVRLIDR